MWAGVLSWAVLWEFCMSLRKFIILDKNKVSEIYFVSPYSCHKFSDWCALNPPSKHLLLIITLSDLHKIFLPSINMDPMDCGRLFWGCRWWHSTRVQEVTSRGGVEWNKCHSELHLCIFWNCWWGTCIKKRQSSDWSYTRRGSYAASNW